MTTIKTQLWIDKLQLQELPALASTVKMLSKLSQDELSSLSELGRSVLHDGALTACILKVANSANHRSVSKITTVSRACVVLGFKSIRNICITSKLLGSLLKSQTLSKRVYLELVKLMSQSFHGAMIAKMLMSDYDEDTQEEIFIATLLFHLGENAFWSLGGKITEKLEFKLRGVDDQAQRDQITEQLIGTNFGELNKGLAQAWNLSDVLVKALDDPEHRTAELGVIELADNFSRGLVRDFQSSEKKNQYLLQMSQVMSVDINTTVKRINQCNQDTLKLLDSFGVTILQKFIPTDKVIYMPLEREVVIEQPAAAKKPQGDYQQQLKMLKKLTFSTSGGFNQIIESTISGIESAIAMDRVLVLMFNSDKTAVAPRFHHQSCDSTTVDDFTLQFYEQENIFLHSANELLPVWIREPVGEKYKHLLTRALKEVVSSHGFVVAPLIVGKHCVGLIYADRKEQGRAIRSDDFDTFTHFTQLTNLCISAIVK